MRHLVLLVAFTAHAAATRADGPMFEPLKPLAQETKTEFKLQLKAKTNTGTLRFSVSRLRKDGKEISTPNGMKLTDVGAFAWTPTPSQAGTYDLTLSVMDAQDRSASVAVQLTVRPRAITTAAGPVGALLRKWHAEKTAAGNTGDFYDNRDRDHSPLDLTPYPQLDQVAYTADQRKKNLDWAAQTIIPDRVTFGNSSTSAPVLYGGSNPRHYYTHPRGMTFLYEQYRKNNLYMYPAHHDHHPGRNGKPFYGDVYPANSPYLIVSQGSSGTDQPFMRAVPLALAAFRPEVKETLVRRGMLMPTLQMLFRSSNKHLKEPKDYLTGKAHPPVFEGAWVDDLKMVQAAHAIQSDNIPPLIQLKAVKEDEAVAGKDFFEPGQTEKLHDTPAAICRVIRGSAYTHRIVVSADGSFDLHKKPLKYHWVVLRGDPKRIEIKPVNAAGSVVEILVPYHERRKIDPASAMESNRVDIGAFVHNGTYYSAPGFVTFFSLDNEARAYDEKGRLLEIGYGAGETELAVSSWNTVFALLKGKTPAVAYRLLTKHLEPTQPAGLIKVGDEYEAASAKRRAAEGKYRLAAEANAKAKQAFLKAGDKKAAEPARKRAEAVLAVAQRDVDAARKAATDLLGQKRAGLAESAQAIVDRALKALKENPMFAIDNRAAIADLLKNAGAAQRQRLVAASKRLVALQIAKKDARHLTFQSIRASDKPLAETLTRYERMMVEWYNGEVLAALVFPRELTATFKVNFVDQRLSAAKNWRDIYRHDSRGELIGWTRYDDKGATDFNADGLMVVEKDDLGRARKARTVQYEYEGKSFLTRAIKWSATAEAVAYEYKDDKDMRGRVKKQ